MILKRLSNGLQRVYTVLLFGSLLIRLPWWALLNLFPAQRPRRSWSIFKCLFVNFIRFLFVSIGRDRMKLVRPMPTHTALRLGKSVHGVYVDGVLELITGQLKDWATQAGVEPVRLPGYWMHKRGSPHTPTDQKPNPREKVFYFLHGGAYVALSAHPHSTTSNIPRALLRACPAATRSFAIEYRLSSVQPDPPAGAFPAALLDALAGYAYLVGPAGYAPTQVVLVGDSAGGNLALALTRYLVEYAGSDAVPGLPPAPGALILLSPWADMSGSHYAPGSSVFTNRRSDYIAGMRERGAYAVDAPPSFIAPFGADFVRTTPYVSPACATLKDVSFSGFPRTFVAAGDAEVLLDQIRELQSRMKTGMGEEKVVYYEARDAFHDYLCFGKAVGPESGETLKAIAEFVEAL
ncbi:hypothetical protein M0805_005553 [Coniferiporia weirii]|nr:hypothetical protein M0805_005553 [Coniferiporia weirii]